MQSLATTLRPKQFGDVVGQETIVQILQNGLAQGKLPATCIFAGPAGTGKTTLARLISMWLVCSKTNESTKEPCLKCENCQTALNKQHPDIMEFDAATNTGIDDIKECLSGTSYQPQMNKHKIYIIDEVHMLSKSAISSLLKIMEEPPENVWFLLATTDLEKIPFTIVSRCLTLKLQKLPQEKITAYLEKILKKEGSEWEASALTLIAQASHGCLRAALSILHQAHLFNPIITQSSVIAVIQYAPEVDIRNLLELFKAQKTEEMRASIKALLLKIPPHNLVFQLLTKAEEEKEIHAAYQLSQALEEISYSPYPEAIIYTLLAKAAFLNTLPQAQELWDALKQKTQQISQSPTNSKQELISKAKSLFGK